jgi:hypothetical protein
MVEDTWDSRALPILRAVFDARENGDDLNRAARDAVPDLDLRLYKEEVGALTEDLFLDTLIEGGDGDPYFFTHINRLLPRGLRTVRAWPSDSPVDELLELLARAEAEEQDPEKKSGIRQFREAVQGIARDVLTGVLTSYVSRQIPY